MLVFLAVYVAQGDLICCESFIMFMFFFQAEDGIRDLVRSRGLGDVYKRQTFMRYSYYLLITGFLLFIACKSKSDFPAELVQFTSYPQNPVFKGTASPSDWDEIIRERGYILKEDDTYHLWYTGYKDTTGAVMSLGYATSPDGLIWTRYAGNPIYDSLHTEDMMIIKVDDTYQLSLIHISEPTRPY